MTWIHGRIELTAIGARVICCFKGFPLNPHYIVICHLVDSLIHVFDIDSFKIYPVVFYIGFVLMKPYHLDNTF